MSFRPGKRVHIISSKDTVAKKISAVKLDAFNELENAIETSDISRLLKNLNVDQKAVNAQNSEGDSLLIIACRINVNARFVLALLKHDADPNIRNHFHRTALHEAVLSRNIKTTLCLIKYDACIDQQDIFGNTALRIACVVTQQITMVKLLMGKGANPELQIPFQMPLFVDVALHCDEEPCFDIMSFLIAQDVNINIEDKLTKKTALHIASFIGNIKLATKLLKKRLDVKKQDASGHSPIYLARLMKYSKILSLYEDYLYYLEVLNAMENNQFRMSAIDNA